jgi:ankyrin repeat protein
MNFKLREMFSVFLIFKLSNPNDLQMTEILLKNGANIEKKDKDGCTPLIWGKFIIAISNLLK